MPARVHAGTCTTTVTPARHHTDPADDVLLIDDDVLLVDDFEHDVLDLDDGAIDDVDQLEHDQHDDIELDHIEHDQHDDIEHDVDHDRSPARRHPVVADQDLR